jgi:AcrR family transcriptional regulator
MEREQQHQRASRRRLRGEERRALILRRAKHVFARSTYAEASTGELARESEVTEPMLYKHFGSKKGLFLAVLRESSEQFLAVFQERISRRAEQDLLAALEHVVEDYRGTVIGDPDTHRLFFQAVTEARDPDVAQCVSAHNRKVYEVIRRLVERAHEEGHLDPTISLDAAAWGYMSLILALQYGMMLNLSQEIAQVQTETSRIWLRGLLTRN